MLEQATGKGRTCGMEENILLYTKSDKLIIEGWDYQPVLSLFCIF